MRSSYALRKVDEAGDNEVESPSGDIGGQEASVEDHCGCLLEVIASP